MIQFQLQNCLVLRNIYLGGAAWDGDGLWISVYSPDTRAALYKVNVAARAIVDTISVIGLQPAGYNSKRRYLILCNGWIPGR